MYPALGSSPTPFASNSSSTNDRVAFDNLLRRELKVGDPADAQEVASALLKRYKDDPRAAAIQQEAQGLPFLQSASTTPIIQVVAGASDNEWKQAVSDVERDLKELTTNSLLKDVMPELVGWTQAIRSALQEVETSSRFGLDPRQRDKTLSLRRQLADYARFARLVGALTPGANAEYRQLARSLDEAAAVALVRVGEALANAGFSGNYLLQAPYSELQSRRDAAVYALRVLIGATQQAYGPNDWPRGLNGYRKLYEALELQGQGDLRSLLVEGELSRVMDDLIQRAGNGSADGLRAAGATAEVDLMRFRRLILTGRQLVRPESPPLSAFLESLQLFVDGFAPSGGSRLLRIARPPILGYGIYNAQGHGPADRRLLNLVNLRTQLAERLDCFLECQCDAVAIQAVLDLCLHTTDRAIDLYAGGNEQFGSAERRASGYAYLFLAVAELFEDDADEEVDEVQAALPAVRAKVKAEITDLTEQASALAQVDLIEHRVGALAKALDKLGPLVADRRAELAKVEKTLRQVIRTLAPFGDDALAWDPEPDFVSPDAIKARSQELCMQLNLERSWPKLVPSLVPGCADDSILFGDSGLLELLVRRAAVLNDARFEPEQTPVSLFRTHECPANLPDIPPHYETLLNGITEDVEIDGAGRK